MIFISTGIDFEIADDVAMVSKILTKVFTETCVKIQGTFARISTKFVKSSGGNEAAGSVPRKSINAEIANGDIMLITFGDCFSMLIRRFKTNPNGILDNSCGEVNICVNILTKTLLGISLNISGDEFNAVNTLIISVSDIAFNKNGVYAKLESNFA